jgi:hypothetical protein
LVLSQVLQAPGGELSAVPATLVRTDVLPATCVQTTLLPAIFVWTKLPPATSVYQTACLWGRDDRGAGVFRADGRLQATFVQTKR